MKKFFVFIFLCFSFPLFSQKLITSSMILIPKNVYIGDTAELHCAFNADFGTLAENLKNGEAVELSLSGFDEPTQTETYQIKKVALTKTGVNFYNIVVTFVPWCTGDLQIPSYNISKAMESMSENQKQSSFTLDFDKITIDSVIKDEKNVSLQDILSPILLPGTTYKFYALIILSILLLIFLIRLIVKWRSVSFFVKNLVLRCKYHKNKKRTISALKQGLKEKDDNEFASLVQHKMRLYLEVRFGFPFTKTVTSEMMKGFNKATGELLSDAKIEAMGQIISVFIRTDYVRFNHSIFEKEERKQIVETLEENIKILENVRGENV